jgi:hypothetical protein
MSVKTIQKHPIRYNAHHPITFPGLTCPATLPLMSPWIGLAPPLIAIFDSRLGIHLIGAAAPTGLPEESPSL